MPESSKRAVTIAVSCLSGGSGKTTTSLNLATMLAQQGKTLAVDFDPQGNLSQWLGWTDLSDEATQGFAEPHPDGAPQRPGFPEQEAPESTGSQTPPLGRRLQQSRPAGEP